jgi:predicted nucleic acid-binding protein
MRIAIPVNKPFLFTFALYCKYLYYSTVKVHDKMVYPWLVQKPAISRSASSVEKYRGILIRNSVIHKRIEAKDVPAMFEGIGGLNLATDTISGSDYSESLFKLARKYSLTCYDAAYLELAIRKQAVVGTLDDDLKDACIKAGLQTLTLL